MFRKLGCIAVVGGVPRLCWPKASPGSPAWAMRSPTETDAAPSSSSGSDSLPRHLPGQVLCHRAQHHHRAAPSKFLGAPYEREGERWCWRPDVGQSSFLQWKVGVPGTLLSQAPQTVPHPGANSSSFSPLSFCPLTGEEPPASSLSFPAMPQWALQGEAGPCPWHGRPDCHTCRMQGGHNRRAELWGLWMREGGMCAFHHCGDIARGSRRMVTRGVGRRQVEISGEEP